MATRLTVTRQTPTAPDIVRALCFSRDGANFLDLDQNEERASVMK